MLIFVSIVIMMPPQMVLFGRIVLKVALFMPNCHPVIIGFRQNLFVLSMFTVLTRIVVRMIDGDGMRFELVALWMKMKVSF